MDWTWYLLSFKGRINRAKLWLALFVILGWMIFLAALIGGLDRLLGIPTRSIHFDLNEVFGIVDPATYRRAIAMLRTGQVPASYLVPMLVHTAGMVVFIWIYAATAIKRLHDRDKSGWWLLPFFVAPGLYGQFADRLPDSYVTASFAWVAFALYLWGFVELYFLKGTNWPNRFGPSPLPKMQSRPRTTTA
jgi:uncharacterized membrane protein YhaH (DUF805 family)